MNKFFIVWGEGKGVSDKTFATAEEAITEADRLAVEIPDTNFVVMASSVYSVGTTTIKKGVTI